MPLTSSDRKTLEHMLYRVTVRASSGQDDFDSDYERDLVKDAKKEIRDFVKQIEVVDMYRIEREKKDKVFKKSNLGPQGGGGGKEKSNQGPQGGGGGEEKSNQGPQGGGGGEGGASSSSKPSKRQKR